MKVFKDLEFNTNAPGGIGAQAHFDNGFMVSVIAGEHAYSTPRKNKPTPAKICTINSLTENLSFYIDIK